MFITSLIKHPPPVLPVHRGLLFILLIWPILACTSIGPAKGLADVPCEQVTGMGMASLFSSQDANINLLEHLQSMFGSQVEELPQPKIEANNRLFESTFYQWTYGGADYQLTTLDSQPRRASATFEAGKKPSLGRLLICLGDPDYYSARYKGPPDGQRSLNVDLFYTAKGVIVYVQLSGSLFASSINPADPLQSLNASAPILAVGWVKPGDVKAMDWNFQPYGGTPDPNAQAAFLEQKQSYYMTFRPWPGSIKLLQLTDVDP